ncbi:U3 small nucleolar RNA-associated protein 21-like protein [Smittium mucronatum]|uniref:U3 small nucleolar RNA-associated protein 21-like protein n=1 Tax=Smittium mucronatum TaxID=133383 RepID=A0A1R0GL10_9FUNG|nr:U3 small nucleolar RNA-associated protein 21-like protein [Smittium mucronatum]
MEKKSKLQIVPKATIVKGSKIFDPFRTIGQVASAVGHSIQHRGQASFITTCIGNSYNIYDVETLNLLFVGPQFESQIDCLVSFKNETFVSVENKVYACRRGKLIAEFEYSSQESVFQLLLQQVFESKSYGSPITFIEQSPALDVLGLGFLDGKIVLVNVKQDAKLLSFNQEGKVAGITFRTDLDNQAMMATTNLEGDIFIWDLEKAKIVINMKGAHDGAIGTINFINGQPLLISSGEDNRIVEWIFDNYSGGDYSWPRLLKHRSGHFATPLKVKFYGNEGKKIISSARDQTLRLFSIIRDSQSTEFSQRLGSKKSKRDSRLPNILQFASEESKQRDWDNVLTVHNGLAYSPTWSVATKAIGKFDLVPSSTSVVKAVSISPCGNFGYLGTLLGVVEMFNMQSGISRKIFKGHSGAITGIQTDDRNRLLYTCSLDKTIKFFKIKDSSIYKDIKLPSVPSLILLHRSSDLLAVVCDDLIIRVYDAESGNLVRQFSGHKNQITDLTFSPDGRWLVSSSLDSTIRTWDLPTGYLIDIFKVTSVPISLDFSPNFDFLVTCHADSIGLCLWTNKTLFEQVGICRVDENDVSLVSVPASELGPDTIDEDEEKTTVNTEEPENVNAVNGISVDEPYMLPYQITESCLLTLSDQPKSKWETLLHLDMIKKRNKPVVPAKPPVSAPFFLPTATGIEPKFDVSNGPVNPGTDEDENSRVKFGFGSIETDIVSYLKSGSLSGDYSELFKYMGTQSVSGIDYEIRSISSADILLLFCKAILWQLKEKKNFDFAQAYLNVMLNVHGDVILDSYRDDMDIDSEDNVGGSIKGVLSEIQRVSETEWGKVDGLARIIYYE